jgi:hypothetical protein
MKYRHYFENFQSTESSHAQELTDSVVNQLTQKYNVGTWLYLYDLRTTLEAILAFSDGKIEGKRVLDLGCGSSPQLDLCCEDGVHEPWLCRTLQLLRAHPIGIDLGNLKNEEFEGHQVDLLRKDALAFIPDHSIDIVHSCKLVVSSVFKPPRSSKDWYCESLIPQIERVCKKDGVFVVHDGASESLIKRFQEEWAKEGYSPR